MSIIEALSVGLPVLATAVGGIPEAVAGEQTGYLIPRNVEELAKKLRHLYASPENWQTMSHQTRERFEKQFEISHIVKQYDAVYSRMELGDTSDHSRALIRDGLPDLIP
jgi:glycosyltransferase involved in cell wall biosynthesis